MAHQKTCNGSITFNGWVCPNPGCSYGFELSIDAQPITNNVFLDCSMNDATMSALFMANRINGFTGNITVSTQGAPFNSITITISNVILSSTSIGLYSIAVTNPGFPCGILPQAVPILLTCNVTPHTRRKNPKGVWSSPAQVCIKADSNNPNYCPPEYVQYNRIVYELIGKDGNGNCCYRIKK